jgi:hypothetical protein
VFGVVGGRGDVERWVVVLPKQRRLLELDALGLGYFGASLPKRLNSADGSFDFLSSNYMYTNGCE